MYEIYRTLGKFMNNCVSFFVQYQYFFVVFTKNKKKKVILLCIKRFKLHFFQAIKKGKLRFIVL